VSVALAASQKFVEILTGISLHYKAEVGPGLYLGHFGPLYLSYDARIGAGCNIMHGVTVGVAGRGSRRGVPRIGDRVYIGVYAVVAGDITIGDEAVIGPNAVVTSDVPARTTVVGNPAQVIPGRGTPGMGLHQVPVPARGALRRPADERRLRAL
jgi:serine O-acetyltransferase